MKDEILKIIKKAEKSTTEISNILNRNHYDTIKVLEEMEKDKLIEKIEVGKFTFWRKK